MNQCANQKWNEVFVLNELSFESLNDEIPITIVKNVLKYPEKVREFFDNGYWWTNGYDDDCSRPGKSFEFGMNTESYCEPLVNQLIQFYDAEDILPIEIYANCFNGNMDLYNERSVLPHVDTFPEDDQNYDPLNDIAFNLNLTKSDKVKTAFYSFNKKKSICDFDANDAKDLKTCWNRQKKLIKQKNWFLINDNYENYKLEYIADIEYNSMILYPSHNWHNSYIKDDWFIDEDRVTFTGFFEVV